jgi:hemerythrin superfamily protein
MPTQASTTHTSTATRSSENRRSAPQDAIQLLRADHRKVQALFDQFEKARGDDKKAELAQEICAELKVHAQIEEEIFYPAARKALKKQDLIAEATVEHASAKDLIAQIEQARTGDELFDAKVKVLGEYIKHHVKEEQNELFPQVKKTKLDLKALGRELAERKDALTAEM